MKFIHAADLHLDSPFQGLQQLPKTLWAKVHNAPFQATKQLVHDAITQQVDFVLLVGDLFDRETQSIQAQTFLNDELQQLLDAGIQVIVSYGNHDYMTKDQQLHLPAGVIIFGPEVTTQTITTADRQRVAISGFSYADRWIDTDMVPQFPEHLDADFQIGMLHGAVQQTGDNHYAPFTLSEMAAKHYDYWALGHIHKPNLLAQQPPIVYAGTIQGRHKNEPGAHGYQLVTSAEHQLKRQFVAADQIRWQTLTLMVDEQTTDTSLIRQVQKSLKGLHPQVFALVELQLNGIEKLSTGLLTRLTDGTWQARFDQEQQRNYEHTHCWVYEVTLKAAQAQIQYAKLDADFWQQAQTAVFTQENIELTAGKLMQYPFLADHLQAPKTTAAITARAKNELLAQSRLEVDQDADHKA
ncbi:metallophosphoesterase family protein [Secundilactobacillus folii]|uniref:metallophosphoesterase family protein n=1 Tax=Secundilactobacillus folii TaxID=2678357 RepID=UPI0012D42EE5|nr:DNA repair exonuclease [Secundilactobacillus folii]